MANFKAKNVKRFVEDISKDVAEKAYEGGGSGGGSSLIEVPANSTLILDGNKLLQLLIAKGVDVDAELTPYSSTGKSGILLGWSKSVSDWIDYDTKPHMIYPESASSTAYHAKWTIDGSYGGDTFVDITVLSTTITFKTMLSNTGEKSMYISTSGKVLIPCLAVTTSSSIDPKFYDLTTAEFLSFITITPITE